MPRPSGPAVASIPRAPPELPTLGASRERSGDAALPLTAEVTNLLVLATGAILGALTFSLLVGRHRARRLARHADLLAQSGTDGPAIAPPRFADPVLSASIARLAGRIAEVEALAATDPLTRLLNRLACLRILQVEIERANRYGRALAVALIDIDHFKRVNDTHGHAVGDEVLRHVAAVLRANVRGVDSLGRYGGEEFLLVMPETDIEGALASTENLRRLVAGSKLSMPELGIRVTISVGLTGSSAGGEAVSGVFELDRVLREADAAMYTAKALGRNQLQVFRAVDEDSRIKSATIDAAARRRATRLGRAAFDASSQPLLQAIIDRPGWAGGPSRLIADLAGDVARAAGLPDGDIERIRTASLLHDLGKLAIPDEILNKPAPLSPTEWRAIVEHPKIAQVVLEQSGAIRDAASIVLHHHEWFDGRGYPYGLSGAEIPIGARIVAIADAYEAMTSDRPYKRSVGHDQALSELERGARSQFDPDLVEIFSRLFVRGVPGPRAGSIERAARRR
jgi:two-component system cell cycle response regulator